jgi:hypothetical protein
MQTGKRGAVRNNSGLPVDHSGPGLGVGPTTPLTAGRKPEACPPSLPTTSSTITALDGFSLSQRKSGQGPVDGVPGGGEAAAVSSFNPIQTNRNSPSGRGKHCGQFTVRGQTHGSPEVRFFRVNCKSWNCRYCAPRRAKRYKHAIRAKAESLQLRRFVTLTLDPKKIDGDPVRYLKPYSQSFVFISNAIMGALRNTFGCSNFKRMETLTFTS